MSTEPLIIRSFAGGELSPTLAARADLAKYTIGLRRCRNFVVHRHGGASNRSGTRFVGPCKTNSANVKLLRYVSEVPNESVLIEAGAGYLRFWQNGAQVEIEPGDVGAWSGATDYVPGDLVSSGGTFYYCRAASTGDAPPDLAHWHALSGTIYEVPHPFVQAGLFNWVQSGRVITLTHESERPHDLVFQALTRWVCLPVETVPKVAPPENPAITPPAAGSRVFGYVITAAAPGSYEESEASAIVVAAAAADPTPEAPHELSWDAVLVDGEPAPEYYVYCDPFANGTFGFIGTATGAASFNNPGLTPDFGITPPIPQPRFQTDDDQPNVCAYHGQRRWLANTPGAPDAMYGSRVGFPDNYGISSPLQDDDAIASRIAGNNSHAVRHLVALKDLLVMTDGGEWRMVGAGGILAPNTIGFDQETYVGVSHDVPPVIVGNSVIYLQARDRIVRDLRFDQEVEGLAGRDLTIFASHLFDGFTLRAMDYAQTPDSHVWCVRSDGVLLGLTYLREQDIWGWHRHHTASGQFFEVRVIPEAEGDVPYFIVTRNIGGAVVQYIERLESRVITDFAEDAFFVDSGLSYSGAPVAAVAGLSHLNGQVVDVVGDGQYLGTRTVSLGAISLGGSYSTVHVGLPIDAEIETLDLDVHGTAMRPAKKRVQAATVLVDSSTRQFRAGPSVDQLTAYVTPPGGGDDESFSGAVELNLRSRFEDNGRVVLKPSAALPLTVLAIIPHAEMGG